MPSFGTLKADTLTHSTAGSVTTDNVVEGVGKVRSNFDGTTSGITPRDSFNVSSVGDTNTGTYTINHTNAFSNNDYTCAVMGRMQRGVSNSGAANGIDSSDGDSTVLTTSHIIAYINVGTTGDADVPIGGSVVFGDMA
tara:strand:+ start:224 stop:637 length:414 start_codon:yes stop_codon:yes gene_type:complete